MMNNDQRGSTIFVEYFQRTSKTTKANDILPECSHQHLLLRPVPVASLQAEKLFCEEYNMLLTMIMLGKVIMTVVGTMMMILGPVPVAPLQAEILIILDHSYDGDF